MQGNAVMRSQSYAVAIEHILGNIFGCERFGFGGVVNSDYIRKQPFAALFCGLACLYPNSDSEKKNRIEKFIEDHMFYVDMSIDFLLSFETNSKTQDITTIEIDFNNGEEALQSIIETYRDVVK